MKIKYLYRFIGNLSYTLFPNAGPVEHIKKLKQEADEVITEPNNLEEYADCLFALISASVKAGFTLDDLLNAAHKKALINQKRKWKLMQDGTHQHIEDEKRN